MGKLRFNFLSLIVFTFFILLVSTIIKPQTAFAVSTSDGYQYNVSGNEVTITGYSGSGGNITILETINDGMNTYTVTKMIQTHLITNQT